MNELISVIVPVYNVETFLPQAAESILSQTYCNLEVFFVDDGSTDSSGLLCDEYAKKDSRVSVIHKRNGGQGQARNIALDQAKGEYITFLDSDDFLEPQFIEKLHALIQKSGADLAVSNYNYVSEEGKQLSVFSSLEGEHLFNGYEALSHIWNDEVMSLAPWAKLYKKSLWESFRFKECYCEDAATMPYLYKEDLKVAYTGEPLVNYRIRMSGDVRSFSNKKLYMLTVFDEMMDYAKNNLPVNLQRILIGKVVSANLHVYCQLPKDGYLDEKKRIRHTVRTYRRKVLLDTSVRKKTRIAAFVTYFGFNVTVLLFNTLKKRRPTL